MKATTAKGRTWVIELDVVGLRFRWKRDGRKILAGMCEKKGAITGIRLEREPDSRHDVNAIKVLLPERILQGKQLGYLRADTAALLAPKFDAGALQVVSCKLAGLQAEDDWNTGHLEIRFRDLPAKKRSVKPKTRP